jgi:type I restriction enzyme S subunit
MMSDLDDNHHQTPHAVQGGTGIALSRFADISSGFTKGRDLSRCPTLNVAYLTVVNVLDGALDLKEVSRTEIKTTELEDLRLRSGDILMTEGGDRDKLGRGCIWEGQIDPIVCQNHIFRVRVDGELLRPRFLHYLLQAPASKRYFFKAAKQTSNLCTLNSRDLRRFQIPHIELGDQDVWIETLNAADDHIRALDDQLRKAERVKTAQLQYYYVAEPHRKTETPQPKPWATTIVKLGRCGRVGTGGTPDRANKDLYGGTIPWVKSGEVLFNTITDTEEKLTQYGADSINGELYAKGSVIIALYGAGQTRGRAAILGIPAYVNQALAAIICDEATVNEWLFYWFQRNYERVRSFAGGSSQDNLNLSLLKDMDVSRPDVEKQSEIVAKIKANDDLIASLNSQRRSAQRVKQSLLQSLLTGRIRLKP